MANNPYFSSDQTTAVNKNPYFDSDQESASASLDSSIGSQDDNGMCQRFVEKQTYGRTGIFPTAVNAWENYAKNGQAFSGDVNKSPAGSLVYFAPDNSNGNAGHVGISDGKGNMVSATYNGVEKSNISNWISSTKQQPLGFVKP